MGWAASGENGQRNLDDSLHGRVTNGYQVLEAVMAIEDGGRRFLILMDYVRMAAADTLPRTLAA